VNLRVVGYVSVDADDEYVKANAGAVAGRIEILSEYVEALDGLQNYSHIFIISILHKISQDSRGLLKVKPRRLLRLGLREEEVPTLGVFATDSPARPNPIGLTLVKLVKIQGNILYVEGLDLYNETPVIDIKPYRPEYRAEEYTYPDWVKHDKPATL